MIDGPLAVVQLFQQKLFDSPQTDKDKRVLFGVTL